MSLEPLPYLVLWPEGKSGGRVHLEINGQHELEPLKPVDSGDGRPCLVVDLAASAAHLLEGVNEIAVTWEPPVEGQGKLRVTVLERHPGAPSGDLRPLTEPHFVSRQNPKTILHLALPV